MIYIKKLSVSTLLLLLWGCQNEEFVFTSGLLNNPQGNGNNGNAQTGYTRFQDQSASGTFTGRTIGFRDKDGKFEVLSGVQNGTFDNAQDNVTVRIEGGEVVIDFGAKVRISPPDEDDEPNLGPTNEFVTGTNPKITGVFGLTDRDTGQQNSGDVFEYVQYLTVVATDPNNKPLIAFQGPIGIPTNNFDMPQFNVATAAQTASYRGSASIIANYQDRESGAASTIGSSKFDADFAAQKATLFIYDYSTSPTGPDFFDTVSLIAIDDINIRTNAFSGGKIAEVRDLSGEELTDYFSQNAQTNTEGYFYGYSSGFNIPDEVGGIYIIQDGEKKVFGAFIGD